MKKLLCVLLIICIILPLFACDSNSSPDKETSDKSSSQDNTPSRLPFDYEEEYTRQHLEFIDSDDYMFVTSDYSGLAGLVGRSYEDAKLNYINGTWVELSYLAEFTDSGKVELVNEYEILITELMLNSDSQTAFAATYEQMHYDFLLDMMVQLKEYLGHTDYFADILTGDELRKLEIIVTELDDIINSLLSNTNKPTTTVFEDALKQLKEKLNIDFLSKNQKFIKKMGDFLGGLCHVGTFTADTINDCMDYYITYQSMMHASDEWEQNWSAISSEARTRASTASQASESYTKIADCIDLNLERARSYRNSEAFAIITNITTTATHNGIQQAGSALWKAVMSSWPTGAIALSGFSLGVATANCITNANDLAYYGQMLIGYGNVANCAYEVLLTQEDSLRGRKDYSHALLFDSIFNIYKKIQLSAADCTIHYFTAIASAPLGYIFKNTTSDEIAASYQLLAYKADLSPIRCHGIQQIYNNGGYVVGFSGNVYYFRLTKHNVASTGVMGYFEQYADKPADLVCRNADGEETILTSTSISARNIYICGNKLLFKKGSWWNSIGLDDGKITQETQNSIVKYLPDKGMLVVSDYADLCYATDFSGNTIDEIDFDPNFPVIAEHNGNTYTYSKVEGDGLCEFHFYRTSLDGKSTRIGLIEKEQSYGSHATIGDVCIGSDALYVSIGQMGGTGLFFNDGTIYRIPFESDEISILADDAEYDAMYLARDNQGKYLYYCAEPYSGVDIYEASIPSGVKCINLATNEITDSDFPLCQSGVAFINNGELQTLFNNQPTPTTILSSKALSTLGYKRLGILDNGSVIFHEWAQLVDDTYYVLITEMIPHDESSVGWRQGYQRIHSVLYSINIEDGSPTEIYSY